MSKLNGWRHCGSVFLVLVTLFQGVPAPVPRCSPFIIINKLAEFTNILSDSNPYFPVPPCEYGGPLQAIKKGDLKSVFIFAEPQKVPQHNFYELIWLLKTGGARIGRIMNGQEKLIMDNKILREGYRHYTPYVRTQQLGQYTKRNPKIIDDKKLYKRVVGNKIRQLFKYGKDRHINKHYTFQGNLRGRGHGGRRPSGSYGAPAPSYSAPSSGYGAPSSSYGAPSSEYGAPAPSSSYGAPAPSSSYGAPSSGYGAPAPASSYGAPSSGYGAPSAPSSSYSSPSLSTSSGYSAPSQSSSFSSHGNSGFNTDFSGVSNFESFKVGSVQSSSPASGYQTPFSSSGPSATSFHSSLPSHSTGSVSAGTGYSGFSSNSVSSPQLSVSQPSYTSSIITSNNNQLTQSTYDVVNAATANPFVRAKKSINGDASEFGAKSNRQEKKSKIVLVEDPHFLPSLFPEAEIDRPSVTGEGFTQFSNARSDDGDKDDSESSNVKDEIDDVADQKESDDDTDSSQLGTYFFSHRLGKAN